MLYQQEVLVRHLPHLSHPCLRPCKILHIQPFTKVENVTINNGKGAIQWCEISFRCLFSETLFENHKVVNTVNTLNTVKIITIE